MRTRQHGLTDTGHHRDNNEDAYCIDPELGLFIICDGVGGNLGGEIASQLAADLIRDWVRTTSPPSPPIQRAAPATSAPCSPPASSAPPTWSLTQVS